ncbi:MAG: hypothetical protein ACI9BW_000035 [Gammaproteobacteria bacterium]|jgi:hypothetical protein
MDIFSANIYCAARNSARVVFGSVNNVFENHTACAIFMCEILPLKGLRKKNGSVIVAVESEKI